MLALTETEVGSDDHAWSGKDDLRLLGLAKDEETMHLFADPKSAAFQAMIYNNFGGKYDPEQCVIRLRNIHRGIKATDKCKTSSVTEFKITHWDPTCQTVL